MCIKSLLIQKNFLETMKYACNYSKKRKVCDHVLRFGLRKKIPIAPDKAKNIAIGKKRGPGRPSNAIRNPLEMQYLFSMFNQSEWYSLLNQMNALLDIFLKTLKLIKIQIFLIYSSIYYQIKHFLINFTFCFT